MIRAITCPTGVVCSRPAGQVSTPRSASARRLALIRFRHTPSHQRFPTRGSSVATVPAISSSAAVLTAPAPARPARNASTTSMA